MAYQTVHTKKNGIKYVYSVTSYWDKEKKAPRNKQVCLGRLDEATGEIIKTDKAVADAGKLAEMPEIKARNVVVGPTSILERIALDVGLIRILKRCFPEQYLQILSLAYFLVHKGLPLSRCEMWSTLHRHPFNNPLPSQRVSEILRDCKEEGRQAFFAAWMKHLAETECFFYDITSVSSYSEQNEYIRYGHNRDNEKLPQINLAMLFGQKSGLPAYYRRLQGGISDVSTLKTTVKTLDFIGQTKLAFVLDRGFYSETNVDALFDSGCQFVLACPRRKWTQSLYDEYRDSILSYKNRYAFSENEVLYMQTKLYKWNGYRCYAHIYFNNVRAAEELDAFALKLALWQEELESGNDIKEHQWAYEKYFVVKDTPKRGRKVVENIKAVQEATKKYVGFFCLLTPKKMDALKALEIYRRKEAVENSFDDLKNTLDMKRLRIHSSYAMDSRLFIQFISLIILSKLREIKNQNLKIRHLTVREVMEAMESISEIRVSGRYGKVITEADPLQRDIMCAFDVHF